MVFGAAVMLLYRFQGVPRTDPRPCIIMSFLNRTALACVLRTQHKCKAPTVHHSNERRQSPPAALTRPKYLLKLQLGEISEDPSHLLHINHQALGSYPSHSSWFVVLALVQLLTSNLAGIQYRLFNYNQPIYYTTTHLSSASRLHSINPHQ